MIQKFEIELAQFVRSYSNITFSTERLGALAHAEYQFTLNEAFEKIGEGEEFEKYAKGLRFRYQSWLSAQTRRASSAIVGGGNFNVAKAEKFNALADKRFAEISRYKESGLKRALKTFEVKISFRHQKQNELTHALEDLRLEIHLNEYLTKGKQAHTKESIVKDLVEAGFNNKLIDDATYRINQIIEGRKINITLAKKKIKTIEQQIKDIEAMDAINFDLSDKKISFVNDKEGNRFKLFFSEKPSVEIISQLKKMAFKYAQSSGAWQAIRTNASAYKIARLIDNV